MLSMRNVPLQSEPGAGLKAVPRPEVEMMPRPVKSERISALDFTKGALVLFMVLYHWLNYFVGSEGAYYRYLRFLTPSFILITGFMVSQVYLSKYSFNDPRLPHRLFVRAFKLLSIFIALNATRIFILPGLGTGPLVQNPYDRNNLMSIFISGNLGESSVKLASFSILVPISYVLLLSGALMIPYRFFRYSFHLAWLILVTSISVLVLRGAESQNLELVTIGMFGVLIGFMPMARINKYVRHPYFIGLIYALYLMAIARWNVPYPLEFLGTCFSVAIIYLVGTIESKTSRVRNEVLSLGKYSLFGYISQIAILQVLEISLRHFGFGVVTRVISFILAFTLTIGSVRLLDRARRSAGIVDGLYKFVFN